MIIYKEHDFQPFMSDVDTYSHSLNALNERWENAKLLCEINCPEQAKNILPSMTKIQNNFLSLQDELISTLISETINKTEQKTTFKAQVAVDILIRNLYERTADVGFLATDDDICRFVSIENRSEQDRINITRRLQEYVAKYTVYEEIIILDKNFTVLANLDENNPVLNTRIDDSLLQETLDSDESFVESFKFSPLQANKKKAHIFSKKIIKENTNEVAGIICLCFRFEDEMAGIFNKLSTDYDGSVIMIIDEQNNIIASSDSNHIPVGIRVEPVTENENGIVYYRGIEYIAKTVSTKGYQGYYGLGWKGHVMIPLNLAFKDKSIQMLKTIDPEIMSGLMIQADSFSAKLKNIMGNTQTVNKSLKRIVYNGQIIADDDNKNEEYLKLKPLLNNINKTGTEIRNVFEKSVKNLFATMISTNLREDRFLASHCIDIMDRNLYERSDDCRWWALNPTFKAILSKVNITENDRDSLTKILQYINSLYTVYTNLFLFDKTGKIIAVSNHERSEDIDKVLDSNYVKEVLKNNRQEKYFVSAFEKNQFYDNRYTYIYGASITDIHNCDKTVGGIGIIFDSEFQFNSMLEQSISSKDSSFAVFADKNKKIISSTNKNLPVGSLLNLPQKLFELKNGDSYSEILIYEGCYYVVGCACSTGYREYKNIDGYKNDVIAFVFEKLADCVQTDNLTTKSEYIDQSQIPAVSGKSKALATFIIDDRIFALDKNIVFEAVESAQITSLPESSEAIKGVMIHRGKYVTVLNTPYLIGQKSSENEFFNLLILKLKNDLLVALIVDELNNVLEVGESLIKSIPQINGSSSIIKGVVSSNNKNSKVILVLNEENLIKKFDPDLIKLDIEKIMPLIEEQNAKQA